MPKFADTKSLRGMTDEGLRDEIQKIRRQLFDLRSQAVTEKLQDTSLLKQGKRTIARVQTILRERTLAAQSSASSTTGTTATAGTQS